MVKRLGAGKAAGSEPEGKRHATLATHTYGNGTRFEPGRAPVSADALVWAATRVR